MQYNNDAIPLGFALPYFKWRVGKHTVEEEEEEVFISEDEYHGEQKKMFKWYLLAERTFTSQFKYGLNGKRLFANRLKDTATS